MCEYCVKRWQLNAETRHKYIYVPNTLSWQHPLPISIFLPHHSLEQLHDSYGINGGNSHVHTAISCPYVFISLGLSPNITHALFYPNMVGDVFNGAGIYETIDQVDLVIQPAIGVNVKTLYSLGQCTKSVHISTLNALPNSISTTWNSGYRHRHIVDVSVSM